MALFSIRKAIIADLPAIVAIYNQAVAAGLQTADTEPWKAEDKITWFNEHQHTGYPIFTAVTNDNTVAGFVAISPYRPGRGALRFTKEVSYYINHHYLRQGAGEALLKHAIQQAAYYTAKTIIAIVLDTNKPSVALLEKMGFAQWGCLPNVAEFEGITCSHLYFGLKV